MKIVLRAFALGGPDVLMWADDELVSDPGDRITLVLNPTILMFSFFEIQTF